MRYSGRLLDRDKERRHRQDWPCHNREHVVIIPAPLSVAWWLAQRFYYANELHKSNQSRSSQDEVQRPGTFPWQKDPGEPGGGAVSKHHSVSRHYRSR